MKMYLQHCLGCLIVGLSLAGAASPSTVSRPWLPVTPQDLKQVAPGDKSAAAIQLYFADEIDDVQHDEFFYDRVKVLSDSGKDHGNVKIAVLPGTSIHDLEARTIHPDGSIIMFSGSAFDTTILRGKGIKILAKTFAFPEVTVGSILEYKYRLHRDDNSYPDQTWMVQHDLYTVKEHFWFRFDKRSGRAVSWVTTGGFSQDPQQRIGAFEMDAENVPAFEKEELMPPEDGYRFQVKFYYGGTEMVSASNYWSEYGSALAHYFKQFVGERKEIKNAAEQTIGNESDPETKLKKLYSRAQNIENLSFERRRTPQEQKKENFRKNENIEDVLHHAYGESGEITALFVGMASAAGFDASLVMVSSRSTKLFDDRVMSLAQLDSLIARVQVGNKQVYLEPGTRFCPFGTLRWMHTATYAMDLKHPGDLVQIPGVPYSAATTNRTGQFDLTTEGNLKGTISFTFTGAEALEHRLAAIKMDEAGRNRDLEQELKDRLPAESVVKFSESRGWTDSREPLTTTFSVEIPGFASSVGKRLLLPTGLFDSTKRVRFTSPTRKYPIYFHYAYLEADKININVPDGYSVESVPEQEEVKLSYARYARKATITGKALSLERILLFNGVFVSTDRYTEFKDFFAKVNSGDQSQSVLRSTAADAQKAN